jgi:ferric-dicitrate binding protein FerR (iron transport regulator)
MNKENLYNIEDFLLDDTFVAMAERNCPEEIQAFLALFSEQQQTIRDAITLIRALKIKETACPLPDLAERDYQRLLRRIRKRRQMRRFIGVATTAAAACVALVLSVVFDWGKPETGALKNLMLSQLDSVDVRAGQMQLIAGTSQFHVEDNDTVCQTENGVRVGKKTIDYTKVEQVEYLQLVVPYGKRTTLALSDGTLVWINSGTTVIYPRSFKDKREIFIVGEAYLEVAKDEAHPFIVHSKKFDVTVLGTKFNVHSFDGETEASVVLVEGSVEVVTEKNKNKLLPNEGIFYNDNTLEIKEVDAYSYICWKDGFMKLEGEALDAILRKLSRYYKVEFDYDTAAIASEMYAGKLNLANNIEDILCNLLLSTPFTFSRENNKIHLEREFKSINH